MTYRRTHDKLNSHVRRLLALLLAALMMLASCATGNDDQAIEDEPDTNVHVNVTTNFGPPAQFEPEIEQIMTLQSEDGEVRIVYTTDGVEAIQDAIGHCELIGGGGGSADFVGAQLATLPELEAFNEAGMLPENVQLWTATSDVDGNPIALGTGPDGGGPVPELPNNPMGVICTY